MDTEEKTQSGEAESGEPHPASLADDEYAPELQRELSNHSKRDWDGEKTSNVDLSRETLSIPSRCPSIHRTQSYGKTVVTFREHDPEDPYNWPAGKKFFCAVVLLVMVLNSAIGSTLPAGASGETAKYFNITNDEFDVLPISIYLIGYILGPMVFAPMSEQYGRKIVMVSTFVLFTAFTLGTALAPTFAGLIVMRLLVGIGASTPMSVIGGIYADLYNTPRARGTAVAGFMAASTWGPIGGPIISGFAAKVSWRWTYWIQLIIAGVTWPFLLMVPETYGPVLLQWKAKKLRKDRSDVNIVAPADLEKQSVYELCTVVLTRPIRMFLFEAIVLCVCLYLSLVYGIFYIFFQAYPIIFQGIYGFNPGEVGLTLLPIGVGSLFAAAIYLWWDFHLDKVKKRHNPPIWSQKEEYYRLPLACLGGPLFVISLFWLGWTARQDIHWIVPTLAAIPFGIGFLLIFMALINYMVDAYEIFAASAMGAASASRSVFGVVLPFAAKPLYDHLGVAYACTLLGSLSALVCIIPFVFIKYGQSIRENSAFCQELKQKKAANEEKQRQRWERERSEAFTSEPDEQV